MEPPPRSFLYVAAFGNDFTYSRKPLYFLTRKVYPIPLMEALLEACEVTNNGRHLGTSSWIFPRTKNNFF